MQIEILHRFKKCKALWTDGSNTYLAQRNHIILREVSGQMRSIGILPVDTMKHALACWRPLRQGLRLGVHNLWRMPDGAILAITKGAILRRSANGGEFRIVERFRVGNKPDFNALTVDSDGRVYYGEYSLNRKRLEPIGLHRSDDGGQAFNLVYEFPAGDIRHIHFLQFDPYEKCLWMGTGDRDAECRLYRSEDAGVSWELIGSGEQKWRSVGLAFTERYLYWGTDAGSDTGNTANYIVRWSRQRKCLETLKEVQGPCHGISALSDGTLVVSTGIEGGANEIDDRAHLWVSRDGENWQELANWEKDFWPFRFQYGVIYFPHGLENSHLLHYTTFGLANGGGETYYVARIHDR